jgi:hypothetical protein
METITIPKSEYMQMQQAITTLQQQLNLAQDGEFIKKMMLAYQVFVVDKPVLPVIKQKKRLSAKELAYHKAIIEKGGDATYFGDAAEWQRAQREDRDLPFFNNKEL